LHLSDIMEISEGKSKPSCFGSWIKPQMDTDETQIRKGDLKCS
jgi:hypothetical protein